MEETREPVIDRHIELIPDVCGGKPRIRGHRIRVMDIVAWHEQRKWSPDEIVMYYPQLTPGDVYAALAYNWDHRYEMRSDVERAKLIESEARRRHPSKLRGKLERKGLEILSGREHPRSGR